VRIGIDMLPVQAESRLRGIGRYSLDLATHLLALDPTVEFILYAHEGLPDSQIPSAPNATRVMLRREPASGERELADVLDRLARENPDELDTLLLLSPFDQQPGYGPPAKPLHRPRMAAVIYDLIPFVFQEHYLADEGHSARFYRHLERLRSYDALLAISEATRADCQRLLGARPGQVVNISGAVDPTQFGPGSAGPRPADSSGILNGLGITEPYVFCLSGIDERKNWRGLIDAYALLPDRLRESHQLVVTCKIPESARADVEGHIRLRGMADRVVLTDAVPDDTLRVLYQRCAAFAFPSLYEGFGLPILEALHCGAPVLAGNNSSQVEVVGDAGLLVNAGDPSDVAQGIARLLTDEGLARTLRDKGPVQAARFSWERTASDALRALGRRSRRLRVDSPRPRLAVFSPFPPKNSGIADYTARLVHHLKDRYAIDLYHDSGYIPHPALASPEYAAFDHRLFARNSAQIDYRGVLYHMGNSQYHRFIYEAMGRHAGIVTLHDFCLSGFHWWYRHQPGIDPDHFLRELTHHAPGRAVEAVAHWDEWLREPGGMQEACAQRGLTLNRSVFDRASRVIVHSPWCVDQVRDLFPEHESKMAVVPMGATVREITPEVRAAIRARFDLPADALVFASFGILHMTKMNAEAIEAFAGVARAVPSALFAFVGQDLMAGQAREKAAELGLLDRVRFLGRQPDAAFADLIAAADIGVSLRLPPTNGETSAALMDLLGCGVPTIATDVGTFAGYPDAILRKVRWDADGPDALARVMLELATDRGARETLGRSAARHVRERHAWKLAAAGYAAVIEDDYARRRHAGGRQHRRAAADGQSRRAATC